MAADQIDLDYLTAELAALRADWERIRSRRFFFLTVEFWTWDRRLKAFEAEIDRILSR